jgi:hypothetical protein
MSTFVNEAGEDESGVHDLVPRHEPDSTLPDASTHDFHILLFVLQDFLPTTSVASFHFFKTALRRPPHIVFAEQSQLPTRCHSKHGSRSDWESGYLWFKEE